MDPIYIYTYVRTCSLRSSFRGTNKSISHLIYYRFIFMIDLATLLTHFLFLLTLAFNNQPKKSENKSQKGKSKLILTCHYSSPQMRNFSLSLSICLFCFCIFDFVLYLRNFINISLNTRYTFHT